MSQLLLFLVIKRGMRIALLQGTGMLFLLLWTGVYV